MSARSCIFCTLAKRSSLVLAALAPLSVDAGEIQIPAGAGEWIGLPAGADERPAVMEFRRRFDLAKAPKNFIVRVSADNAFILYVNGQRVISGPSTSDIRHWRYSTIDLAPFLHSGRNVVSATVWNYVKPQILRSSGSDGQVAWEREMLNQTGRLAQQSLATGFWLEGAGRADFISTSLKGWKVAVDRSHVPVPGPTQVGLKLYYVASAPEVMDTRLSISADPRVWSDAAVVPHARRHLIADRLPAQKFMSVPTGKIVFADFLGGRALPDQPVTIPARTTAKFLVQRDAMLSGYPEFLLDGGRDSRIQVTYAEAPYDAAGEKGDRNEYVGKQFIGMHDEIIADGQSRSVIPLEWRTWRYLEISVQTADTPLTLRGIRTWESGYPFQQKGFFRSSDPELDKIWQIGWRTALVDAHDTYMDSAYWEQLQYIGDTRLQMLISYAISGDARLAEQAIDAFASSNVDGGLLEGAWPSRGSNSIAPFSLLWIGMLHDWLIEQSDRRVITRNLPRMREVLDWYAQWRSPGGLLRKNPQWNFIDWVGQDATDRTRYPSYGRDGESCLTSILYLGALIQAQQIETAVGDTGQAGVYGSEARELREALRRRCYSHERGLYADNPDLSIFSQQMNALAVLYDVVETDKASDILDHITMSGRGIDAPAGMYQSSYYFAWYLIRAFEHAGKRDSYVDLLQTWRDLLKQNFTTWPEERGHTRSDSHAWSAHPSADLLRIVAGIGPGAPGYAQVRVAPVLGRLMHLDAGAMTPDGLVAVKYRIEQGKLHATIDRPASLNGWFEWAGKSYPLSNAHSEFVIEAE